MVSSECSLRNSTQGRSCSSNIAGRGGAGPVQGGGNWLELELHRATSLVRMQNMSENFGIDFEGACFNWVIYGTISSNFHRRSFVESSASFNLLPSQI